MGPWYHLKSIAGPPVKSERFVTDFVVWVALLSPQDDDETGDLCRLHVAWNGTWVRTYQRRGLKNSSRIDRVWWKNTLVMGIRAPAGQWEEFIQEKQWTLIKSVKSHYNNVCVCDYAGFFTGLSLPRVCYLKTRLGKKVNVETIRFSYKAISYFTCLQINVSADLRW